MTPHIPASLRREIRLAAGGRCAYCRSHEDLMGISFEIDHVIPLSEGGATALDNLCLSCPTCNRYKANKLTAIDPVTGQRTALFHPRTQVWNTNFSWDEVGIYIIGITPVGRATVESLRINRPVLIQLRGYWIALGLHPPQS